MNKKLLTMFTGVAFLTPYIAFANQNLEKVVDTNAHEGPVCVESQDRIYFTTKPDLSLKNPKVSINYLDLKSDKVHSFIKDANMANGMWLSNDKKYLIVAEQGTLKKKSAITMINLNNKSRKVIVDSYHGKPFNSINKVIESKGGVLYFSDPDYGYNQGFKGTPQLENAVYAYSLATKQLRRISTDFLMPHGLALSDDEKFLYIGDTSAIDGVNPYNKKGQRNIYKTHLDTPFKISGLTNLIEAKSGIPDGFIYQNNELYVSEGDGVHKYSANSGKQILHYTIPNGSANLVKCGNSLYILADTAIYKTSLNSN